jgi:hypothetical protein
MKRKMSKVIAKRKNEKKKKKIQSRREAAKDADVFYVPNN